MSYLRRPRLHFSGKAVVQTATANNSGGIRDGVPYFDVNQVMVDTGGDPEAFREWMHQLNIEGYINSFWNYYGDNHIRFDPMTIHGVEMTEGNPITDPAQDAIIGSEVRISGDPFKGRRTSAYLVDTDPTDAYTTQLFSGALTIQSISGLIVQATQATRGFSRWLNYWRNLAVGGDTGASAWWQVAFPKAGLEWGSVAASPAVQALQAEMNQSQSTQGLVMRFCTYLFRHPSFRQISRRYEEGKRTAVEGALVVSGTIGVWDEDEFASIPSARLLIPPLASAAEIPPEVRSQRKGSTYYLGATLATVDTARQVITLDLINTLPEVANYDVLSPDANSQNVPEKIDLGTLTLGVQEHCLPETCQKIALLPFELYQRSSYWLTSGIVELPYPPEMEADILNGDLVLFGTPDKPLLEETPYVVLTDQRSVYLDLEDDTAQMVTLQVLLRGAPAPAGLNFPLSQTINEDSPAHPQNDPPTSSVPTASLSSPTLDPDPARVPHTRFRLFKRAQRGNEITSISSSVKTGINGMITLPINPFRAGTGKIWLHVPDGFPVDQLENVERELERYFLRGGLGDYLNIRVLPNDSHHDQISDEELTWEYIHREVFSYYSLLYPAMNVWINLDNEDMMRVYAAEIKSLVSAELRHSTLYMPVTRELSAGRRRLIQRWADLQLKNEGE
jgi:hypothetical protein